MNFKNLLKICILIPGIFPVKTLASGEIVVYSSRKEQLIAPVFKEFTKKTGIEVIVHTGKDAALIEKLKSEGKRSKADILMTVDGGNLWNAARHNLFMDAVSSTSTMRNTVAGTNRNSSDSSVAAGTRLMSRQFPLTASGKMAIISL